MRAFVSALLPMPHSLLKICLSFLFWIIPAFAFRPLYAEEMDVFQTEEVIVLYEASLGVAAKEVAALYPGVRRDLQDRLGWRVDFVPTAVLIRETETFQRIARNPLTVAFAVPEKNLMVIDYSRTSVEPFSIEATLKHELCHLLLHRRIRRTKIPRWLDEGIAQWASGGMADIVTGSRRSVLTEATLGKRLMSLRSLSDVFPGDRDALLLAYEESKSLVAYIVREYGVDGLLEVLDEMSRGRGWEEAVFKALSVSPGELEAAWHHDLRKRLTWFTYLMNNLYEILFFFGALVMVAGFARRWWKKRRYYREDEEDGGNAEYFG